MYRLFVQMEKKTISPQKKKKRNKVWNLSQNVNGLLEGKRASDAKGSKMLELLVKIVDIYLVQSLFHVANNLLNSDVTH